MSKVFGIDLGTRALKIYKKNEGVVYDAKNILAIADANRIIAIGDEAFDMFGKAPSNIEVTYPVQYGVIADIKNMQSLLNLVFEKLAETHGKLNGAEFIVTAPTDITEVEKKAFIDLVANTNIKPRKVRIAERPVADALGAGLNVTDAAGVMVVDIGADTTEVSVLSLGGIVLSRLIPVGGNKFDEDIISNVKKKYNLFIGNKTAEVIKIALATAVAPSEDAIQTIKVFGRDVVSGLPVEKEIDSLFVYESIAEHLHNIVDSVKMILEHTPPEIASDIIDSGIYVTGGSAQIHDLKELLSQETELGINICNDSANTVALGLGKIIEEPAYDSLAYVLKQANYKD
ncbi:MAG: rod shape-determining protein [Lachnospiraceae bacterium]|nr:rod shape-determining protein [Lachnospiraceae bacterium]